MHGPSAPRDAPPTGGFYLYSGRILHLKRKGLLQARTIVLVHYAPVSDEPSFDLRNDPLEVMSSREFYS